MSNQLDALKARVRGITIWNSKADADYVNRLQQDIERLVAVVDIADVLMASEMQRDVGETSMVQVQFDLLKQLQDALAYWLEEEQR